VGAVIYGLSIKSNEYVISSRVLKYTYGIKWVRVWKIDDPRYRKTSDGMICAFRHLVKGGTGVKVDETISFTFVPKPDQTNINIEVFYTRNCGAKYCDEPGVVNIDLPGKLQLF
jgi:hypothetical protein